MQTVLFVCPEAPYPALGGGAQRIASLIEYFAERGAAVDVLTFMPFRAPERLVREVLTVPLPANGRSLPARVLRNAGRLCRGVPPLIDRLSGFDDAIRRVLDGRKYDVAFLEHFWVAPYVDLIREHAAKVWCDLHNIESVFFSSLAASSSGPMRWAHRRFSAWNASLENALLPRFDGCLVCSDADAERIGHLAPVVFPNTIAWHAPRAAEKTANIVFSGNMEYHPNLQAVRWFFEKVWPSLREEQPDLRWRLVGMNAHAVERHVAGDDRVELTGPVPDAISEIASARVAVVPLLSGSGTRVKILEAWAAGTPVVSTAIGAEGLLAGEAVRVADSPEEFVCSVTDLLKDPEKAERLAAAGRRVYEDRFHHRAAWKLLDEARIL